MADNSGIKGILKFFRVNESRISTVLGLAVIAVVGVLVFNYFRGVNQETEEIATPTPVATGEVKLVTDESGKLVPEGLPTTYTVKDEDSLWKIAEDFYTSGYNWVDIAKENGLTNPNQLLVGQELKIPKTEVKQIETDKTTQTTEAGISGDTYTIVKGDNLWKIAVRAYGDGYRWSEIAESNNLDNPNIIHPGNVLKLSR